MATVNSRRENGTDRYVLLNVMDYITEKRRVDDEMCSSKTCIDMRHDRSAHGCKLWVVAEVSPTRVEHCKRVV